MTTTDRLRDATITAMPNGSDDATAEMIIGYIFSGAAYDLSLHGHAVRFLRQRNEWLEDVPLHAHAVLVSEGT